MNTPTLVAALAGNVLAPGSSKTRAVSLAKYAFSSWSPGAFLLFAIIVVAVLAVARATATRQRP